MISKLFFVGVIVVLAVFSNLSSCLASDIQLGQWQQIGSYPAINGLPTIVNNNCYALGQPSSFAPLQTNGSLGEWVETSSPSGRVYPTVFSNGNYFYAAGGQGVYPNPTNRVDFSSLNQDGSLSQWTSTSPMNTARWDFSLTSANGYLYAIGGWSANTTYLNSVERSKINVDGTLGEWQYVNSTQMARPGAAAIALNDYLYVFGGGRHNYLTNTVEKAVINSDGTLGSWSYDTSLPDVRYLFGLVNYDNEIILIGGGNSAYAQGAPDLSVITSSIQENGSLGSWHNAPSLLTGSEYMSASISGNRIYAFVDGNIQMLEITPEPATLFLFTLGGLILRKRKV